MGTHRLGHHWFVEDAVHTSVQPYKYVTQRTWFRQSSFELFHIVNVFDSDTIGSYTMVHNALDHNKWTPTEYEYNEDVTQLTGYITSSGRERMMFRIYHE